MEQSRIIVEPRMMMGKPVVAGTRITVEHILEKLAAGESIDDILAAHPRLRREDVYAALSYACAIVRGDIMIGLETTRGKRC